MGKRHRYKRLWITLVTQKMGDGKWVCRATVDGKEWGPQYEIDDVKNVAMKKALEKTKETIDRLTCMAKCFGVELTPS